MIKLKDIQKSYHIGEAEYPKPKSTIPGNYFSWIRTLAGQQDEELARVRWKEMRLKK